MAEARLRRAASIPNYIVSGNNAIEVNDHDLRWRRNSQAAISSLLPSYGAFHSDTGLTVARALTDPLRRRSIIHRRKSVALLRGMAASRELTLTPSSQSSTLRHLLRRLSTADSMLLGEEDHYHTVASIRSMTASIAVKKKYRYHQSDNALHTSDNHGAYATNMSSMHTYDKQEVYGHRQAQNLDTSEQDLQTQKYDRSNRDRYQSRGQFELNESLNLGFESQSGNTTAQYREGNLNYYGREAHDYDVRENNRHAPSASYNPENNKFTASASYSAENDRYTPSTSYSAGNNRYTPSSYSADIELDDISYREDDRYTGSQQQTRTDKRNYDYSYKEGINRKRQTEAALMEIQDKELSNRQKLESHNRYSVQSPDEMPSELGISSALKTTDRFSLNPSYRDNGLEHERDKRVDNRGGHTEDGFDDIEPDYEVPDDSIVSSDTGHEAIQHMSGFERTKRYHDATEEQKINHRDPHMPSQYAGQGDDRVDAGQTGELNLGYLQDESDADSAESLFVPRQNGNLNRGKSTRRRRNSRKISDFRHSDFCESIPYTEAVKTLVNRRRKRSMIVSRRNSEMGEGERSTTNDLELNGDEDKLPSNRTRKTPTLAQRYLNLQKEQNLTTQNLATMLRDQILSREPSLLTGVSLWKYQVAMQWHRFKNWSKSWIYQLELWAGAFKEIEGQFGTSTMTYFRFLRWLMFLNFIMMMFMILVILLPFLLLKPLGHDGFPTSINSTASKYHFQALNSSVFYTERMNQLVEEETTGQYVLDVLQGTGWLENTELFYGIYFNKTAKIGESYSYSYNMSLAYLCAVGVAFLLSFILLVKNSAKGFKETAVSSGSSSITLYCNKVFGAWDYCISQDKTAELKHRNIRQDLLNELEYQRLQWKKASRTTKERAKLYSIRLLINIFVLIILAGSLYLIYFTNQQLLNHKDDLSISNIALLIMQYLPSVTITLLNVVVPFIFNKVVVAEDYMPAFKTRITLTRIVLLRLASLGILMVSLYKTLEERKPRYVVDMSCGKDRTAVNTTLINKDDILCWETYVGQQIYKLVILNFLVVIGTTFIWEFPRKLIYDKFREVKVVSLMGQQEFDLSKSVLDLVYLQALCWLGMFFSPIIPALCFVKLFIFFYVKKSSLLTNCLPVQQYGTSRSNSLFMMVLLMAFVLAAVPISYMIGSIQPSTGCGPFRVFSSDCFVMFNVISNLVDSWEEVREVFFFMGKGGFMALLALLLCLLMYYFYIVGQAHQNVSKRLRDQLKVEGQDKQFLLARVNEALDWEEQQREEQDM